MRFQECVGAVFKVNFQPVSDEQFCQNKFLLLLGIPPKLISSALLYIQLPYWGVSISWRKPPRKQGGPGRPTPPGSCSLDRSIARRNHLTLEPPSHPSQAGLWMGQDSLPKAQLFTLKIFKVLGPLSYLC